MSLDRHHFQLLAAIANEGQLGAAARSLHLSPSAASHRIREAERRLGITILERDGRVAKLSAAGQLLADTAQSTERQLSQAEQMSRWLTGPTDDERIRVGIGPMDTLKWYQVMFADPATLGLHSVDLISIDPGAEQPSLRSNKIDVTITASSEKLGPPTHHFLTNDRLIAVADLDFRLADDDEGHTFKPHHTRGHDYLAVNFNPLPGWELDRFLDPAESEPRSLRQVDRVSMLLDMVEQGLGLTIQPSAVVSGSRHRDRLQWFDLSAHLPVYWHAVTRPDPPQPVLKLIQRLRH